MDTPEELAAIRDPAERARRALVALGHHQSMVTRIAQLRRQAITELKSSGLSYAQVAERLGVTRGRVAQLTVRTHVLEHEFFGGSAVTIATPLRASGHDRPLIAQEDVEASMRLARFVNAADITTDLQHIEPDGQLDLSPPALVAICGPKSSPVIADLIAHDPMLDFSADAHGRWRIIERATAHTYLSPLDDDPSAGEDVAYVARLPRPTGGAPMLVIAGVHAIGSLGAVHHLTTTTNLHALHKTAGTGGFSMVIASRFSRSPLDVQSATVTSGPHLHEPT